MKLYPSPNWKFHLAAAGCAALLSYAVAGTAQTRKPPTEIRPASEMPETVAIIPWGYRNGKDVAIQSAREACNQLLLETGFNVYLVKSPTGAMPPETASYIGKKKGQTPIEHAVGAGRELIGQDANPTSDALPPLPTVDQLAEAGDKLGARYILAGRAQWRSRTVWINISNRVKSICTVDLIIYDTQTRRLALDAHNVLGDSTENKNPYNSITSAISLNPMPLVMPGSITPQEQHAVTVAIAKAMQPWLEAERIKAALAQADESGELSSSGSRSPVKFSTLLSSLTDLQAKLHVTLPDATAPTVIDSDLARLYALHEVDFTYQHPDRLKLDAESPKDGRETLVLNDDHRSFVVNNGKTVHKQDLSDGPNRRFSLLDFTGLLSPGMFDTMRARFVRQEKVEGVDAVVYDLTYWGIPQSPYDRVWIDPTTHVALRRESCDRDGKLKALYVYGQPAEIAPHIWMAKSVRVEGPNHHVVATTAASDIRANQGVSDSPFTAAAQGAPSK